MLLDSLRHFAKGVAGENLDLSTLEAFGYNVVKTSSISLYCYLFHLPVFEWACLLFIIEIIKLSKS
jgi:hypothetical protein